jgi:nucleoid DNA-binding protein
MKKEELATRLARQAHISRADAADRLDRAIHEILATLKRGNPVRLPGLGELSMGKKAGLTLLPVQTPQEKPRARKR